MKKTAKITGVILLVILILYALLYYRGNYPPFELIETIRVEGTENTTVKIYEKVYFLDDKWCLYYEIWENEQLICPKDVLTFVHIVGMPFTFEVKKMGEIVYIVECSGRRINAIYNTQTKKTHPITPEKIDSLYNTPPFKDLNKILKFCE